MEVLEPPDPWPHVLDCSFGPPTGAIQSLSASIAEVPNKCGGHRLNPAKHGTESRTAARRHHSFVDVSMLTYWRSDGDRFSPQPVTAQLRQPNIPRHLLAHPKPLAVVDCTNFQKSDRRHSFPSRTLNFSPSRPRHTAHHGRPSRVRRQAIDLSNAHLAADDSASPIIAIVLQRLGQRQRSRRRAFPPQHLRTGLCRAL